MKSTVEFRRQVFRTADQWKHGEGYTLRRLDDGGFALFSRPTFTMWVTRDDAAAGVRSLAADDCGRLFWIHRDNCHLYRRDPTNQLIEPVATLGECRGDRRQEFDRAISVAGRLWIVDITGSRLISLRVDTFQIIAEIPLNGARDAAFAAGRLFSLDADGIKVFDVDGSRLGGPFNDQLSEPIALAADPGGSWIYVIDRSRTGFLRYSAVTGTFESEIGNFDDVAPEFTPHLIVVDPDGSLLVSDGSSVAHEFASDGGYIGSTGDVSPVKVIVGLAITPDGELYVSSTDGIAQFTRESGIAGNKGQFYSRTLDSGAERDQEWHRLDLAADLGAGGALDVFYASTDDAAFARAVDDIFDRPGAVAARVKAIDAMIGDRWKGPQPLRTITPSPSPGDFARNMTHSVLFRTGTKRYLWLKLEMSGLAPRASVSVRELRVYYPRLSYLRYLPAVYRQDPVSSEFLERFLSMFETIFGGLEATVERIPEVFDPDLTPADFLDWLAQWLDLSVEEEWPESVKRKLIANAARLYQRKGTPGGLAQFIEIVTGSRPVIREAFEAERPLVLGDGAYLGIDTRVFRQPMTDVPAYQRTVLGCGSVLGRTELGAVTRVPVDPFRAAAYRFTVLLNLTRARFRRLERGLRRIIRENAPAHVSYDIRLTFDAGLGPDAILEVNAAVANPPRVRVGYTTLGRTICAGGIRFGPEVDVDATLGGPESDGMQDCADGER
jgi:phage tail-like protein